MSASAVTMIPEPQSRRQLGDDGLVVFWRTGSEHGRRQGLACILSMCPNPGCACRLVYIDGFVIDERVPELLCSGTSLISDQVRMMRSTASRTRTSDDIKASDHTTRTAPGR